jgi:hypothetical protein
MPDRGPAPRHNGSRARFSPGSCQTLAAIRRAWPISQSGEACDTALWSAGTFRMAYDANRRRAVEHAVDADPVVSCVRAIMAKQPRWVGMASDLLDATVGGQPRPGGIADWPKNPRALVGRLRRSQSEPSASEFASRPTRVRCPDGPELSRFR